MISYACPKCRAFLTAHDDKAGTKHACPTCGQRLQVPAGRAKTVLGDLVGSEGAASGASPHPASPVAQPAPQPDRPMPIGACPGCRRPLQVPRSMEGRQVSCPHCGVGLTALPVVQEAEPAPPPRRGSRRRRRLAGFECPYCCSTYPPAVRESISQTGWILFVVLLIVFFPVCFLGLLMKEKYEVCEDCGARLGKVGESFG
jgi:DNA-directed RNA polymerase subunit RPC12/RpoP